MLRDNLTELHQASDVDIVKQVILNHAGNWICGLNESSSLSPSLT